MASPLFTIPVRDLDNGPKVIRGPIPVDFLSSLLADTDVSPYGDAEAHLSLTIENTDPQILVRGQMDVTIAVPCARTLDPAVYRLQPDIFLLLAPAGSDPFKSQSVQKRARTPRTPERLAEVAAKKAAAGKPPTRPKAKGAWDNDPELGEQDAAFDTYSGDQIVLDDFIREFILLEIPMVPLREDLRSLPIEASPPPPSGDPRAKEGSGAHEEKPVDPRLSPLAELKAKLEQKKKE